MASSIVKEVFGPMIGAAQNDYMIRLFQTVPAIIEQLDNGYTYYIVKDASGDVGFLAFYPREGMLYLSKFYLTSGRGEGFMLEVKFYRQAEDHLLKFAVILAMAGEKMVLVRHRERDTYEIPGGHREAGESIEETAARELKEETGAMTFTLKPVSVYSVTGKNRVNDTGEETYGMLFYAEITSFGRMESEIEKIEFFDRLPEALTYPEIQPILVDRVMKEKEEHVL